MQEAITSLLTEHLLETILGIISLVISYYVIPAIKNDLVPFLKEKRIYNLVEKFVSAVEKLAETGILPKVDKKQKVIELLEAKGIAVTLEVEAFIEGAVKQLDLIKDTVSDTLDVSELLKETE